MINRSATLYLLAFPVGLMGCVQLTFALLSLVVFNDQLVSSFALPGLAMLAASLLLGFKRPHAGVSSLGFRDALLFATVTWIAVGVLGAIPIHLVTGATFTDSIFESVSGITTTGATILAGLDEMPRSFLLYRQFLQWLGGLGIVIFAVAVLPMLNVGGMKLLKAETPGLIRNDKLSPRIVDTARYLWFVYGVITLACAIAYYLCGMTAFDAVAHSLTTVSTGGFSTYDKNLGHFDNPLIQIAAVIFMLAGAASFALHFKVWQSRSLRSYWRDEEFYWFILAIGVLSLVIVFDLWMSGYQHNPVTALNEAVFHLVSFITTTGFHASNQTGWTPMVSFLLVVAGYLGGCAGSAAGGNKIVRNVLSVKLINLEIKRLIHSNGVFLVKYQGEPVEKTILRATVAYMALSAFTSMALTLALITTGLDLWSAFSAVAACVNVVGPAFGSLGNNYQSVSDAGTWILTGAMILGRLEFFTILALFFPSFWRQ